MVKVDGIKSAIEGLPEKFAKLRHWFSELVHLDFGNKRSRLDCLKCKNNLFKSIYIKTGRLKAPIYYYIIPKLNDFKIPIFKNWQSSISAQSYR